MINIQCVWNVLQCFIVYSTSMGFFMTNVCVCLQATEQFASDILREALAGAFAKSPQNRSLTVFLSV